MEPSLSVAPDRLCSHLARSQHGVVTRDQALQRGLSATAIRRRVTRGSWNEFLPGVYWVAGVPESWEGRLFGALKWAGGDAVASHRAAAALWEFPGFGGEVVEITSPHHLRSPDGEVIIHASSTFARHDVTNLRGMALTSPARTLLDLGAVAKPRQVEAALYDALRRRITSLPRVKWTLQVGGGPGRRGRRSQKVGGGDLGPQCTSTEPPPDGADPALEKATYPHAMRGVQSRGPRQACRDARSSLSRHQACHRGRWL